MPSTRASNTREKCNDVVANLFADCVRIGGQGARLVVRQIPNGNYWLTYGKYRERTTRGDRSYDKGVNAVLSWVRQGDAAGMTPYPDEDANACTRYYIALHYRHIASLCEQPPRANCVYAHLRTVVIYQLAGSQSSLAAISHYLAIVTQLQAAMHELRLIFPSSS